MYKGQVQRPGLGARGCAAVVVPLARPLEHIGTVVGLDRELAAHAREAGVVASVRAETARARPTFTRPLLSPIRQAALEAGGRRQESKTKANTIRAAPTSARRESSAASVVYKRQDLDHLDAIAEALLG